NRHPTRRFRHSADRWRSDLARVLSREPGTRRGSHDLRRKSRRCADDRGRAADLFSKRLSRDAPLMRDMRETLRATFGRVLRLENRRRATRRGTFDHFEGFSRPVTVYLPPGYERGDTRYPALYMQDGQNLFDPERAFVPG